MRNATTLGPAELRFIVHGLQHLVRSDDERALVESAHRAIVRAENCAPASRETELRAAAEAVLELDPLFKRSIERREMPARDRMVTVKSESRPGITYSVRRISGEWWCPCIGFHHRRSCRHVAEARATREPIEPDEAVTDLVATWARTYVDNEIDSTDADMSTSGFIKWLEADSTSVPRSMWTRVERTLVRAYLSRCECDECRGTGQTWHQTDVDHGFDEDCEDCGGMGHFDAPSLRLLDGSLVSSDDASDRAPAAPAFADEPIGDVSCPF